MTIAIKYNAVRSTSGSSPSRERNYTIVGAADIDAAEAAISSGTQVTSPGGFTGIGSNDNGMPLDSLEVTELDGVAATKVHKAVATYQSASSSGAQTPPETSSEEISFDLASQTTKVMISKQRISTEVSPSAAGDAPDLQGIGWDGKKFTGVDAMVEVFSFTITKYVPVASMDNTYISNIRAAAFKYNDEPFRGFADGEVLFAGASGSKRNDDDYAIAFKFLVSENAMELEVGDITGIDKLGWDYLWVAYEQAEDTAAKMITPKPVAAYVEQIYGSANLPSLLGISAS